MCELAGGRSNESQHAAEVPQTSQKAPESVAAQIRKKVCEPSIKKWRSSF
jgi:hypothetical protein